MSLDIEEARSRLRGHANTLDTCRDELIFLRDNIPPSPQETSEEDLDGNLDVPTELRAVITIQLTERLEPLIQGLRAAAAYQEGAQRLPLDLTQGEETMGEVVRALVIEDYFTERAGGAAPGEVWRPPGTPEQAELKVFKAWGGWYASWRKLDAPANAPEGQRWERLRLEEDPERLGTLVYFEL